MTDRCRRDIASHYCVDDVSSALLIGTRLQGILACLWEKRPVTSRSLAFLSKQGFDALYRLAVGLGGLICADGGCTSPGDLAKAFGGGADFVMLGGMLAGHDECNAEIVECDGVRKMRFYGMSSRTAMERHAGGVAEYRAAEGKEVLLDCRGSVENTVQEILGGVRSACTYVGARRLKELSKRTTFIRVTQQLNEVFS